MIWEMSSMAQTFGCEVVVAVCFEKDCRIEDEETAATLNDRL
jgi:hypothetical protein